MASNTQDLINSINNVRFNPMAIQRIQLNALQSVLDGTIDVVDASNPFAFLMEMGSVLGAAAMTANEVSTRKQYPSMALDLKDLYLHMSDLDYVGTFASPGIARIQLLFNKEEIYAKVVPTGSGDISQITIPRETYFKVGDYVFTMQYPIDIKVMGHGGLNIVYDVSQVSPLQNLPTNVVTWSIINMGGHDYIQLDIPVYQMRISTSYGSINKATGFSMTYGYPDQYYYARVYAAQPDKTWLEIRTTYTQQVFDPATPTALLTVLPNNQLQVDVPQIYLTTGQLTSELRVDIYSTLGSLDVVLSDYQLNSWTANFVDLDSSTDQSYVSPYVAPLPTLNEIIVRSDDTVTGGAPALNFATLRSRVLANALGNNSLPITNAQIGTTLSNLGYDVVVDVDDVTNRIFMATRLLPPPPVDPSTNQKSLNVSSGIACSVLTLQDSMNDLVVHSTVSDNGNRITLQPSTLYTATNGIVTVVSDATVASLKALPQDALINAINSGNYVYTPFHYVLDINGDEFASRAYYLDAPTVIAKSFIAQNDTLGMSVATGPYQLLRTHASDGAGAIDGYALYVITQTDSNFETLADSQVSVQLSFIPEGEVDLAYIDGTLVGHCNPDGTINPDGPERLYMFQLGTNYDLDSKDNLCLTTFSMFANSPAPHFTPLQGKFNLIYAVNGVSIPGQTHSSIDQSLNTTNLPAGIYGVTQEQFTIQLGYAMTGLWQRARSVASSQDYARYTAPVPWTYTQDIYARDPVTGNILISNDNGTLTYTVIHHAGDPVLDPVTQQPMIKYNVGDVIVDGNGNPQVIKSRNILRQTDIVFLDGVYWFVNSPDAVTYANSIPQIIYGWLTNDIATVSGDLLEQTELYLYPKSTMGLVKGTVVADETVSLEARLSFTVDYYLTGVGYRNPDLRQSLTSLASATLAAALQEPTIAMNVVSDNLTTAAGSDVIGLDISGLGGAENNFTTFTTEDSSISLSIGVIAVANADGTIGVQDNVSVNFLQHTKN